MPRYRTTKADPNVKDAPAPYCSDDKKPDRLLRRFSFEGPASTVRAGDKREFRV
jgi:hypothetical protein